MAGSDLTGPLLQLNPPVLVRANGGDLASIDLAALRRAQGTGGGSTSALNPLSSTSQATSAASLTARKLHEAKRAAHQLSRDSGANVTVSGAFQRSAPNLSQQPHAHTAHLAAKRSGAANGSGFYPAASAASTPAPSGPRAAQRAGGASVRGVAADQAMRRGAAGSAPPSPTAAAAPSAYGRNATHSTGGSFGERDALPEPATAIAATAAEGIASLQLPYLMRHIQDIGALLDTLFPLRSSQELYGRPAPSPLSSNADGAPELTLLSVQTVSTAPASREDVMALHAMLRARLEARRARPTGLCDIRRSLYADLFSELVRQITVEEPARGLLLARVRENEEHAIRVHAALLREGESFVADKLLRDTKSVAVLEGRLAILRTERTALEVQRHQLQIERQEIERRFEEERQARHKEQQDELNYLRRANQQLSLRLKLETERASAGADNNGAGVSDSKSRAASTSAVPAAP